MALSLLLADDQPAIAKIISLSLPREEYEIRSVTSVKEAMNSIATLRPDFFLVDVSLRFDAALDPAMNPDHPDIKKDGIYLTRYIKEHDQLKSIQVIMLTNAFEPIDDDTRRRYGADGVLVKPFDPSELRTALRELMNDSHRTKLQSGPATADAIPEHPPLSNEATDGLAPGELLQPNPEVVDEPTMNLPALDLAPDPIADKAAEAENELENNQTDSYFSDAPDIDISQLSEEAQELSAFFSDEIAANDGDVVNAPETPSLSSEGTTPTLKIPPGSEDENSPVDLDAMAEAAAPPQAAPGGAESFHFDLSASPEETADDSAAPAAEAPSVSPKPPGIPQVNPLNKMETLDTASSKDQADPLASLPDSIDSAAEEWKPVHPNVEDDLSAWQQADNKSGDALFDTGGSNFEFHNDYIKKVKKPEEAREERAQKSRMVESDSLIDDGPPSGISAIPAGISDESISEFAESMTTKRFELIPDDEDSEKIRAITQREITKQINVLGKVAEETLHTKIKETSDALTEKATNELADQLSDSKDKLEALIREETRKQCTELVEKIAWDIIPELAENIIRKELDKVLTALEKDPE